MIQLAIQLAFFLFGQSDQSKLSLFFTFIVMKKNSASPKSLGKMHLFIKYKQTSNMTADFSHFDQKLKIYNCALVTEFCCWIQLPT